MEEEETDAQYVLRGKLENVKTLTVLLRCIHFKDIAVFFASNNGLKVVVEDSKCVQASAFIDTNTFQEFSLEEELVSFRIDITVLMECLQMFDTSNGQTSLDLYYKGYGFPLRLVLLEEDIVTDCSIKTMEALEILHFDPPGERVYNKLMADGLGLKELLSDLDTTSEFIELLMSDRPPNFMVRTESTAGKCEASAGKEAEWVEDFLSNGPSLSRYKFSQIKPALKMIQAAKKVSLQVSREGLLCMQFVIVTENKQLCYIEYYCMPVILDDDEEEQEVAQSQEY